MYSPLYWIKNDAGLRLAIMARPRSGDWLHDEVAHWHAAEVAIVVSLLEAEEVSELGLEQEPELCSRAGIEFISLPIVDRDVPSDAAETHALVEVLAKQTEPIAIHCRAGIGRSSLMAACVLWQAGMRPEHALDALNQARGLSVPDTNEQRDWILALKNQS